MKPVLQDTSTLAAGAKAGPALFWPLASLSLSMLMPSLDTSIANAGLPTLAHVFNASFQAVQWIVIAYLLAVTALIVSVGRLGDMIGRRRLLLGGIALFTLASLLCGAAQSLWLLLVARAAQGLGAAVMLALTVAMVGEIVPKARTGRAMGLLGTMSAIGTTLGPSLGGILIAGLGWRMIFLVNIPIGLLNLWLAWRYLPADRPVVATQRVPFDTMGTIVLAVALAAYALAMTVGHGHFGPFNAALLVAALAAAALFVLIEGMMASPLIRLDIFRRPGLAPGLASGLVMSAVVSTVVMATLVVGPFYLSQGLVLPPAAVGLALSVGPLVAALTGIPAGRLVDRLGARLMTRGGLMAMAAGCLGLCIIPASFGLAGYLAPIAVITAGYALFQTSNNTAVMADVDDTFRGVVSGMLNLSRNLGLITGAAFMGAVFSWSSSRASSGACAAGLHTTFAVAAGLIVAALALAVIRPGPAARHPSTNP